MSADWIKFEAATLDKPEVWQVAAALSIDPDAVLGKLLRVWVWFDQHTEEGNAPSVTKMLLDRQVSVPGFCDAMIDAGWMLEADDAVELPNFDRHNGQTAKKRALTAKRVAKHKQKTNASGNESLTLDALPKEEKRREEVTTPHKPPTKASTKKAPEYTEAFERFWSDYPRREGKGAAFASWKKLSAADHDAILLDAPKRAADHEPWIREGGKFVPHPTTYLNQRRWEDDIIRGNPNDRSQAHLGDSGGPRVSVGQQVREQAAERIRARAAAGGADRG